jgi:hypothetical protein
MLSNHDDDRAVPSRHRVGGNRAVIDFRNAWLTFWQAQEPVIAEDSGFPSNVPTSSNVGQLDTYSDTWAFVSNWAHAELTKAREDNDSSKRDETQTALLRGRIRALKELIALPVKKDRTRRAPDEEEY